MQKYRILGKKGEGTFSEVLKCQNTQDGNFYACKRMKQQFDSIEQVNNLREIQAMRRLSPHANIVELHEVIYDKKTGTLALICELLDLNLYEYIKGKKEYLPEQKCCFFMYQALKGLDHMHRNGIFHRDIKPENILVKNDSVKLADFGSCRSVYSKQPYTEYISTRWYRPPECLLTDGYYTYKMDIWSLGCVFYEIMMLRPLFPGSNEVDQISRIHQILGTPSQTLLSRLKKSRHMSFNFPPRKREGIGPLMQHATLDCRNIIEYMCTYDPEERPSAKQILRQLYFRHLRDADKRAAAIAKSSISDDKNVPKSLANISNNSEDKEKDLMLPKMNARNTKMTIQPFGLSTFNTFAVNGPGGSDKLPKHRKESKHHIPKITGYTALPKIPIATNKSSFSSSFPTTLKPANPSLKPKETTRSKIPYGTILPAIKDIHGDHKY